MNQYISKALMLLLALAAYTFGSLLINWSVVVPLKPRDVFSQVDVQAWGDTARRNDTDWFGVALEHKDGNLFVTFVEPGGRAERGGVLAGDTVFSGRQNDKIIFDALQFKSDASQLLIELQEYLTGTSKGTGHTIDSTQPLSVQFTMHHVEVKKGEAYFSMVPIFLAKILGSIVLLSLTAFTSRDSLQVIFAPRTIAVCFMPALGWALADVCEILANGKMPASLYSVLTQSRLVGTALVVRCLIGTTQTTMQMSLLFALTLVIIAFVQVPHHVAAGQVWNGFGKPVTPGLSESSKADSGEMVGMLYALAKISLSILMGVIGQKVLQDARLKELPILGLQGALFAVESIALAIVTPFYMWGTGWSHGFFGGAPVEFWHCSRDMTKQECLSQKPVDTITQGFDHRTFVLVIFYAYREAALNIVLKHFDAMTKNLVNAAATVAVFFLSLVMPPVTPFNATKCALVLVVAFQIQQYAAASVPKKDESSPANVMAERMSIATTFLECSKSDQDFEVNGAEFETRGSQFAVRSSELAPVAAR